MARAVPAACSDMITDMKTNAQIKRISKYEAIYDELSAAVSDLLHAVERFEAAKEKAKALEKYYTGKLWKKDFADDEKGLLPSDLKRGVLSEDGVYDLLCEISGLEKMLDRENTENTI